MLRLVGVGVLLQSILPVCGTSLVMSADEHVSLTSRTLNTVHQLAETNPDRIVLEKDTYLIDENNRVIPIPAGTVAVLEHGAEKSPAKASFGTARDVQSSQGAEIPLVNLDSDLQATNVPADSTSSVDTSLAAAETHDLGSIVSASCEVVEATSSDPTVSMSLSDMYVQEEEEVMEESKDEEPIFAASDLVEVSTKPQSKDSAQKPGRKAAQKKSRKQSDEGKVDAAGTEARRQKVSVAATADKSTPAIQKSAAKSTSTSPAVSTVSASGRPQRSTPRRSAYELLHGGESKPQRRSQSSTAESEQEGSGGKGHPSKKQKVSKSGAADEEELKQSEEAAVASEPGTGPVKGHRGRAPALKPSQTSALSEGCEGSSNCSALNSVTCESTDDLKSSECVSSANCTAAIDDSNAVQSVGAGMANDVEKMEVDVSKSQNKSVKAGDSVEKPPGKKQKQSKKAAQLKQDNCHPLQTAATEKGSSKKKVAGKHDLGSKSAKTKGSKKPRVEGSGLADVDDFKVPGMPYAYFTAADDKCVAYDSDGESSSSLDDLVSEDIDWMGRRILELEQQVRRLQDGSEPQDDKLKSQCWQDVLAEFHDVPSEDVDEKTMLTRYERKLRMLDRELDERACFIRVREGCITRRERRMLEKESELNKRERDLEHQRRLHGHVKLPSELSADSNTVSPGAADSSSPSNRKQALEKEVRLELRKQELDRQKHVLQDTRMKLAAKELELQNREQALVDADLLNMASGFTSESRGAEVNHPNGGMTTAEFSDEDDDDFGGNSLSTFNAGSVSLPFSLDRGKHDSDSVDQPATSEVGYIHIR